MINDSEIMPGRQRIRYDIKKKKKILPKSNVSRPIHRPSLMFMD